MNQPDLNAAEQRVNKAVIALTQTPNSTTQAEYDAARKAYNDTSSAYYEWHGQQSSHKYHSQQPSSLTKQVSWGLLGLIILLEGIALLQNVRFWTSAAYAPYDIYAHVGMAIATSLGLIAATSAAAQMWHRGRFVACICSTFVAVMCAIFSIFAQAGSFAFQEWSAARDVQEVQENRQFAEQTTQLAIADTQASRQALSAQISSIDAQIAEMQKQMQAFGAKNVMTNGWKPANDTLNALVNQKTALTQELANIRTDAPEQPKGMLLDGKGRNAFSSLFVTLSPAFGAPEERVRAWFFLFVPIVCVLMTISCVLVITTPSDEKKA